jgi:hypothetical protein
LADSRVDVFRRRRGVRVIEQLRWIAASSFEPTRRRPTHTMKPAAPIVRQPGLLQEAFQVLVNVLRVAVPRKDRVIVLRANLSQGVGAPDAADAS